MNLKSRIVKSELVELKNLKWFQSESLKNISDDSFKRLKKSIYENGFIQPFNVWHEEETGTDWILDGHHRKRAIDELVSEGLISMPEFLNANYVDCVDRREAGKFLLLYSSEYAHMTQEGFNEFVEFNEIELDDVIGEIDIPAIEFESETKIEPVSSDSAIDEEQAIIKVRCGDKITVFNDFYSVEYSIESSEGKELTDGQEFVVLDAIKVFYKKLKKAKLKLNGQEVEFIDLCEGI